MAIALDTSARSITTTTSYTCTGTNLTLWVFVVRSDSAFDNPTVTYNSVSMTQYDREKDDNGNNSVYAFYLVAPATGAHNIVVTATSFSSMFAVSYTGTKQSGQPDNYAGTSDDSFDTTLTKSVTTVADNSWTVFFPLLGTSRTLSAGTGSTARSVDANGSFSGYPCGIYDSNGAITPAGSNSMTVTCASGTTRYCDIIVSIAPFVAQYTKGNFLQIL